MSPKPLKKQLHNNILCRYSHFANAQELFFKQDAPVDEKLLKTIKVHVWGLRWIWIGSNGYGYPYPQISYGNPN
jgi:hypothetical protein